MVQDTQGKALETGGTATETETPIGSPAALPDNAANANEHQTPGVTIYSQEQHKAILDAQAGQLGQQIESMKRQLNLGALAGPILQRKLDELDKREADLDALIENSGQGLDVVKLRQENRALARALREKETEVNVSILAHDEKLTKAKNFELLAAYADIAKREGLELKTLMDLQPHSIEEANRMARIFASTMPPTSKMRSDMNVGAPANSRPDISKMSPTQKIEQGFGKVLEQYGKA